MIRILLLAILILLLARAFWRIMDGVLEATGGGTRRRARTPGMKLVRDPVCGTFVAPGNGPSLQARGQTYYFCSEDCRARFQKTA